MSVGQMFFYRKTQNLLEWEYYKLITPHGSLITLRPFRIDGDIIIGTPPLVQTTFALKTDYQMSK